MDTSKIKTDMTYKLSGPLEYAHKGEMISSDFIEFKSPNSENMQLVCKLKQMVMRAMREAQSSTKNVSEEELKSAKSKSDEMTGPQLIALILMSEKVDYYEFFATGKQLITCGVGHLGGEQKLNQPLVEKLPAEEVENIIGEYVATFILASYLRSLDQGR